MEQSIVAPLAGGLLIGLAAVGLLLFNGRIAGISHIVGGLLTPQRGDALWRLSFVLGLLAGGALLRIAYPEALDAVHAHSLGMDAAAGLLVGLGARIGNGCTSGHGVCGLARRSPRAAAATATFVLSGIATVYLANHVF